MMHFDCAASTERWARDFARGLRRPTVVLMNGDMGAGKTQITRWCLDELGVDEVTSPTFAIHHRYDDAAVDHVDLYRIESADELEDTGFWDLFTSDDGLVFVEWADRVPRDAWPRTWTRVFVDVRVGEGDARAIAVTMQSPGEI